MASDERSVWGRIWRSFGGHPERWAGGSTLIEPLGLLAIEEERLAASTESATTAGSFRRPAVPGMPSLDDIGFPPGGVA